MAKQEKQDSPRDKCFLTLLAFDKVRLFDQPVTVGRLRYDTSVRELDGRVALASALDHCLLHFCNLFGATEPLDISLALVLSGRRRQRWVEEKGRETKRKVERELLLLGARDRRRDTVESNVALFVKQSERSVRMVSREEAMSSTEGSTRERAFSERQDTHKGTDGLNGDRTERERRCVSETRVRSSGGDAYIRRDLEVDSLVRTCGGSRHVAIEGVRECWCAGQSRDHARWRKRPPELESAKAARQQFFGDDKCLAKCPKRIPVRSAEPISRTVLYRYTSFIGFTT